MTVTHIDIDLDTTEVVVSRTGYDLDFEVESPAVDICIPGVQGPPGKTGLVKVVHGDDPNVPRPDAPLVYWVGSVHPVYSDPDDLLLLKESA